MFSEVEVDERSREMETIYVRNLRAMTLGSCGRYAEAIVALTSLYRYQTQFGGPPERLALLQEVARVYQKAGDRQGALATLQKIVEQTRSRGPKEVADWATTQLQRIEPLSGDQMASLDEQDRLAQEVKRDKRHQAKLRRREEKKAGKRQPGKSTG